MSIIGNDISRYQGNVNFEQMKAAGSKFVYIRLGYGYTKDKKFEEYKQQAKLSGMLWGTYWVPTSTARVQNLLDAYFALSGGEWGDLPPAIDVETDGLGLGLFKMWHDQTRVLWEKTLPRNTADIRKKPTFYTRASHFDRYIDAKKIKAFLGEHCNLWVAHYTYSIDKKPTLPKNWKDYLIHQYSADENGMGAEYGVSSRSIDLDSFNGDEFKFMEWTGLSQMDDPVIDDAIVIPPGDQDQPPNGDISHQEIELTGGVVIHITCPHCKKVIF